MFTKALRTIILLSSFYILRPCWGFPIVACWYPLANLIIWGGNLASWNKLRNFCAVTGEDALHRLWAILQVRSLRHMPQNSLPSSWIMRQINSFCSCLSMFQQTTLWHWSGLLGRGLRLKAAESTISWQQLNWMHFQRQTALGPSFIKASYHQTIRNHRFFSPHIFNSKPFVLFEPWNDEADSRRGCKHDPGSPQWYVWMTVPEARRFSKRSTKTWNTDTQKLLEGDQTPQANLLALALSFHRFHEQVHSMGRDAVKQFHFVFKRGSGKLG